MHVCHQHRLWRWLTWGTRHIISSACKGKIFRFSGQQGLTLFNPWATWSPPAAQLTGIIPDNKGVTYVSVTVFLVVFGTFVADADYVNAGDMAALVEGCVTPVVLGVGFGCIPFLFVLNLKGSCHLRGQLPGVGWVARGPPPVPMKWFIEKRHNPSSCKPSGGWCHNNISMLGSMWGLRCLPWAHKLHTQRFCLVTVTPGRG